MMAANPELGFKIVATIESVKGVCNAAHTVGEQFTISCYHSGGLCGFFYHDLFPTLMTFQFGGNLPWWDGDTIVAQCPDAENLVTIKLKREARA